jgi:hypothetical protein
VFVSPMFTRSSPCSVICASWVTVSRCPISGKIGCKYCTRYYSFAEIATIAAGCRRRTVARKD